MLRTLANPQTITGTTQWMKILVYHITACATAQEYKTR